MAAILVVDDDARLRDLMAQGLARHGHSVFVARDGNEGMRALEQHNVEVMVTDVVMPEQDGLVLLQAARKLRPRVRIVVISGDSPRHSVLYLKLAAYLGAHHTLLKPFTLSDLLAAVDKAP